MEAEVPVSGISVSESGTGSMIATKNGAPAKA
jgi:hypothetical protein